MWSRCPINQFKNAESLQNPGLDSDKQGHRDSTPYKYVEPFQVLGMVQTLITFGGSTNWILVT